MADHVVDIVDDNDKVIWQAMKSKKNRTRIYLQSSCNISYETQW